MVTILCLVDYTSSDDEMTKLFAWGGCAAASLKLAAATLGLLFGGLANIRKNAMEAENELEVGLRRLSSWGILLVGSLMFGYISEDPHKLWDMGYTRLVFLFGAVARTVDYVLDFSLAHAGENFRQAVLGNPNTPSKGVKKAILELTSIATDEIRGPTVLVMLASSLVCLIFSFTDNYEGANLIDNVSNLSSDNRLMFWFLFVLLVVHSVVALNALVAHRIDQIKYGALSTSELVRTIVSTAVLFLYGYLIGAVWGSRELLLAGLVLYTACDVIGRNLL